MVVYKAECLAFIDAAARNMIRSKNQYHSDPDRSPNKDKSLLLLTWLSLEMQV